MATLRQQVLDEIRQHPWSTAGEVTASLGRDCGGTMTTLYKISSLQRSKRDGDQWRYALLEEQAPPTPTPTATQVVYDEPAHDAETSEKVWGRQVEEESRAEANQALRLALVAKLDERTQEVEDLDAENVEIQSRVKRLQVEIEACESTMAANSDSAMYAALVRDDLRSILERAP